MLKQLDHIAFRVDDLKTVVQFYTETLGFQIVQKMEIDLEGTKAISNVLQLDPNPFFIFVDQGLEEGNIITKWVKRNGSGLHHMAYLVSDIHEAHNTLMKQGMSFTTEQVIDTGGGLKQYFSTPNPVTNLITELIQRDRKNIFFVQKNVEQLIQSTKGL